MSALAWRPGASILGAQILVRASSRAFRECAVLCFVFAMLAVTAVPARADLAAGLAAHSIGDYAKAYAEFLPLARRGVPEVQAILGKMYELGQGVAKDDREAVRWYRAAAEQGLSNAQSALGAMYMTGRGVAGDDIEAVRWLRKAAEQRHAAGLYGLGIMYQNGRGVGQDDREAVALYRKAADLGAPQAQNSLGRMYTFGRGVDRDLVEAARWFRRAADQGNADAQLALGGLYGVGVGVEKNATESARWTRMAAEQGDARAQNALANDYAKGEGVVRDDQEAVHWYRRAADQGHEDAQAAMGFMYETGRGLGRDFANAIRWYRMAADQGNERALTALVRLDGLTPQPERRLAVTTNRDAVAVIIGNKAYTGDTPEVDYAYNDANAMKKYVIEALGYREGNIIDLRDASLGDLRRVFGTERNHRGQLFDFIRDGQSDVTVFYSGHGVPGLQDKRGYLLPVDGDPNRAEITGYPLDVLQANLAQLPARSMQVFLDACFSGNSAGGMLIQATSGVGISPALPEAPEKFVMLTAASGDQVASWDRDAQLGLFTKHLLEALNGRADDPEYGNGDGKIALGEVKTYLDREMTFQARRRFGRDQNATMVGIGETVLGAAN